MKSLFISKTFILALVQAIAGLYAVAVMVDPTIATYGWVMIGKSIIDILLRLNTTEKVYIS